MFNCYIVHMYTRACTATHMHTHVLHAGTTCDPMHKHYTCMEMQYVKHVNDKTIFITNTKLATVCYCITATYV